MDKATHYSNLLFQINRNIEIRVIRFCKDRTGRPVCVVFFFEPGASVQNHHLWPFQCYMSRIVQSKKAFHRSIPFLLGKLRSFLCIFQKKAASLDVSSFKVTAYILFSQSSLTVHNLINYQTYFLRTTGTLMSL